MGNSSGKLHEQVIVGYRNKEVGNNNNNNNTNNNNDDNGSEMEYQIKAQKLNGYFLELNQLGLNRLTDAICDGKHLRGLHLARNSLTCLPAQFGQGLLNLCFLDLSFNKFSVLPDCLSQLTNLIELKAAHNNLDELPYAICGLTKLENLDLSYNHLTNLPTAIGHLDALISLNLEKNLVSYLPAEIGRLKLLRHLNLDDCPLIMELPEVPKQTVPTLRELASRVINRHNIPLPETVVPHEVIERLQAPHGCCSFCSGPFYETHIKRFRFVNKGPYLVALEYRLCSLHWLNEKDRILSIFRPTPLTAPSKLEPSQIEAINHRINTQIRPKPLAAFPQESKEQQQQDVAADFMFGKPSIDSNISILFPNASHLNARVHSNSSLHINLNNLSLTLNPAPHSPSSLSVDNASIKSSSKVKAKTGGSKASKGKAPQLLSSTTTTSSSPSSSSTNTNVVNKRRKASLTCSSNELGGISGPVPSSSNTPFTQMEFIEESVKMKSSSSSSSIFKRKGHY